jgi:type IV pilus assembly protein PilA
MKINKKGFTLIELLIVIAIIGVLAAIAIPQFISYRSKSYNSTAMTDLRNVSTAQEAYFVDHKIYSPNYSNLQSKYGVSSSSGVIIDCIGSQTSYTITAYHSSGNRTYTLTGPGGSITGD